MPNPSRDDNSTGQLLASPGTGADRSHQEGTAAEPFCMIHGAESRRRQQALREQVCSSICLKPFHRKIACSLQ